MKIFEIKSTGKKVDTEIHKAKQEKEYEEYSPAILCGVAYEKTISMKTRYTVYTIVKRHRKTIRSSFS